MAKKEKFTKQTHSYLALRKSIGWIGILLPFVLMIGVFFMGEERTIQNSISHYYHTGMRDAFVGALSAVALFMFFYCGYDKWDDRIGNVTGFFAIGAAWFPTTKMGPIDTIGLVHLIFAALFFITLAVFSLFLFTKKAPDPTPRKLIRNRIYIACGLIMIACLAAIAIYFSLVPGNSQTSYFVFWAETIALLAFGISWLTKGEMLYPDK